MTNTKFRKRALLSSVAMLLVALVALGSATFAWFTQNTSATASGINVSTAQASNLQISKNDLSWGTSVNYAETATFEPASSADGNTWYTAEAGARNNFAKKEGNNFVELTAQTKPTHVFEESLNVKNAGAADVTDVKISFSINETVANTGYNYVRVALVPMNPSSTPTAQTMPTLVPTAADFRSHVYDIGGSTYNAVTSTTAAEQSITAITASGTVDVPVGTGTLTQNEIKYFKLYVWFEGQDEDCYADNAGNALPSIQFSVTGTTSNS